MAVLGLALASFWACGCSVSKKTAVKPSEALGDLQTATKTQLIDQYNRQADSVHSVNLSVKMKLTAGSNYSGVIEQYHEVNGFMLASRPVNIRVIGQAPVVGKNIFDMVSNGEEFRVFIPSKKDFIVGPTNLQRVSKKPVENLRPQHLIDALLWKPISPQSTVLFEQANEPQARYYVLTVLTRPAGSSSDLEIEEKIWFSRADLNVSRIESYGPEGVLVSDDSYAGWAPVGDLKFAQQIDVNRPADDYQLQIAVTKSTLNEAIAPDRFILPQPPGTQLVRVGEADEAKEAQP